MGLKDDVDRTALRQRYSELVRRYHPDRNGGDRSLEAKLGAVIEAYQTLKGARGVRLKAAHFASSAKSTRTLTSLALTPGLNGADGGRGGDRRRGGDGLSTAIAHASRPSA